MRERGLGFAAQYLARNSFAKKTSVQHWSCARFAQSEVARVARNAELEPSCATALASCQGVAIMVRSGFTRPLKRSANAGSVLPPCGRPPASMPAAAHTPAPRPPRGCSPACLRPPGGRSAAGTALAGPRAAAKPPPERSRHGVPPALASGTARAACWPAAAHCRGASLSPFRPLGANAKRSKAVEEGGRGVIP